MTTIIEKVLQLQDIDFFRFAHTEHLAQLASVCQEKELEEGTSLFLEGQTCKTFYLLIEGRMLLKSESGANLTVQKCALDQWSFLAQETHQYSAASQDNCLLFTVSHEEMIDLLTAEPEFGWAIARYLAKIGRNAEIPQEV